MRYFIACLPHYTSGQTYYYPGFKATRPGDAEKFSHEFGEVLAMPILLETLMRVRASRGLSFRSHGLLVTDIDRFCFRHPHVVFPRQLLRSFD